MRLRERGNEGRAYLKNGEVGGARVIDKVELHVHLNHVSKVELREGNKYERKRVVQG